MLPFLRWSKAPRLRRPGSDGGVHRPGQPGSDVKSMPSLPRICFRNYFPLLFCALCAGILPFERHRSGSAAGRRHPFSAVTPIWGSRRPRTVRRVRRSNTCLRSQYTARAPVSTHAAATSSSSGRSAETALSSLWRTQENTEQAPALRADVCHMPRCIVGQSPVNPCVRLTAVACTSCQHAHPLQLGPVLLCRCSGAVRRGAKRPNFRPEFHPRHSGTNGPDASCCHCAHRISAELSVVCEQWRRNGPRLAAAGSWPRVSE